MKSKISRGVLGVCLLVAFQQAHALKLSCNTTQAGPGGREPVASALSVEINEESKKATAKLGNYFDETELNEQDDNLAEFAFDSGAEAAVWETENADGSQAWTGFVLPEDEGFRRIKCLEVK